MWDRLQVAENADDVADRRASERLRPSSLICVKLGPINGGIVFDISEGGLALTAAVVLADYDLLDMQIQFPESDGWVEATGQIVWRSESRKEAGVRFVGLSEPARRRIRSWIVSEGSSGSGEQDNAEHSVPADVPPDAPPERETKLSSSDVPVSEVDSYRSSAVEHTHNALISPPSLNPSDATPLVSELAPKQTAPAKAHQEQVRQLSKFPDRRLLARRKVLLFTYAALGEDNGGIVFNLGEGGFAITVAAALQNGPLPDIRLRFPESEDWIEANGRVAWISQSGREAGIQFVTIAEKERIRIREWVLLDVPAAEVSKEETSFDTDSEPELASTSAFDGLPAEFTVSNVPGVEPPSNIDSCVSTTRVDSPAEVLLGTSEEKPVPDLGKPEYSLSRRRLIFFKLALSGASAVLLALGWMTMRTGARNETVGIAANKPQTPSDLNGKPKIAALAPENHRPQQLETAPQMLAHPEESSGVRTQPGGASSSTQNPRNDRRAKLAAVANAASPTSAHQSPRVPSPHEPVPMPTQVDANTADSAVHHESAPSVRAPSTQEKESSALSSDALPAQPASAPVLEAVKEKSPPMTVKQPEAPVMMTGSVAVSSDPYPSIRMPDGNDSKKSHQARSLQFGHLLSQVEPAYPEEAKQHGIEGAVKMHAIFNRDGAFQSLVSVSGNPSLVPSATNAIRQWRYSKTLLGGRPMETEEDITIVFRLSSGSGPKN